METQKRSVYVIDDDRDIRGMLSEILELEGYHVVAAANGREALSQLRSGDPPCVILLDLMMPVMDGWEFRAQLSRDPALASIPIVVLSGDGNIDNKIQTMQAACYLKKPVDLSALLATVGRYSC